MEEIHKIRHTNMMLVVSYYRSRADFASAAKISPQQASQLINHPEKYRIGSAIAQRIENAGSKPTGWLDINHELDTAFDLSINLIVETTIALNNILRQHGLKVENIKEDAYSRLLTESLKVSAKHGLVSNDQLQSALFSSQLATLAE